MSPARSGATRSASAAGNSSRRHHRRRPAPGRGRDHRRHRALPLASAAWTPACWPTCWAFARTSMASSPRCATACGPRAMPSGAFTSAARPITRLTSGRPSCRPSARPSRRCATCAPGWSATERRWPASTRRCAPAAPTVWSPVPSTPSPMHQRAEAVDLAQIDPTALHRLRQLRGGLPGQGHQPADRQRRAGAGADRGSAGPMEQRRAKPRNGSGPSPLRILVFGCEWSGHAAAELAGANKLSYPVETRLIRLRCSARFDPIHILWALFNGADGVFLGACAPGDCHYIDGNRYAQERITTLARTAGRQRLRPPPPAPGMDHRRTTRTIS